MEGASMACAMTNGADLLADAADAASDIYKKPEETDFQYWRKVEQFRLAGELAAGVRFLHEGKTAIVAIRGTSLLGNWIFTNFQAHFAEFNVVDDSLSAVKPVPYQGGSYRTPVHGAVHQGFFRGFSWLWYGSEPILGETQPNRTIGLARLRRYLTFFLLTPLALSVLFGNTVLALAVALALAFVFVTFEAGVWEDIFKEEPRLVGSEPFRLLRTLNECEQVVFTGHSLGGAIATIAFSVYRSWCRSDSNRRDNAVLFTFGAPRVGDVPFMQEFSKEHRGRFCHVVHPGDPVPELPPNGLYELWYRRIWTRGPLGFVVVLLFPIWATIGKLYQANRAARWEGDSQTIVDGASNTLKFSNHSMQHVYRTWAHTRRPITRDA
jgi:hypothetical protein